MFCGKVIAELKQNALFDNLQVLRMVDIQTVSIMLASASVIAGVVYYALQIRQQTKIRHTDFIMRMPSTFTSKEFIQSWVTIGKTEFNNFDDFVEKCFVEASQVAGFCENLGVLVHRKLVDIALVMDLYAVNEAWEKLKPRIEENRKRANNPKSYEWFEYLYNEMKKREQKLQQSKV